tara:strand:- start:35 stop:769 length:735 start_codon:yes stop_codon:yes gene_type:complete
MKQLNTLYLTALLGFTNIDAKPLMTTHVEELITFKQAIGNSLLRQQYLDNLLQEEANNTLEWNYFNALKYQHSFEVDGSKPYDLDANDGLYAIFASTDIIGSGMKPICTVYGFAFDRKYVQKKDDFLSLLDNEAFHASHGYNPRVKLKLKRYNVQQAGMISKMIRKTEPEFERLSLEILSYDYQFNNIHIGKRKVSSSLLKAVLPAYEKLYNKFQTESSSETWKGHFARLILDSLKVRPSMFKK